MIISVPAPKSGFTPPAALVSTTISAPRRRIRSTGWTTKPAEYPSYRWKRPCCTTTAAPARWPKSSLPACPGAVAAGQPGSSAKGNVASTSTASARPPSPEPSTIPTRGRRPVRSRIARSRAARTSDCSAGETSRPSTNDSPDSLIGRLRRGWRRRTRAAAAYPELSTRTTSETLEAAKTMTSGPNSAISWRHMPHGVEGSGVGVTTATARIAVSPALTAPTTALRSAQIVAPYEADSTLHPG